MRANIHPQILFAAVVLGVSVVTVNWVNKLVTECKEIDCGSVNAFRAWNPQFEYGAFVGAFGLLDAFIGIAAIFVGAIPWIATAALDGLAAVFYLAGGIVSCTCMLSVPTLQELTQVEENRRLAECGRLS